jgi:hypothetical protein
MSIGGQTWKMAAKRARPVRDFSNAADDDDQD